MDSSFPPGESGAKISPTWLLLNPRELAHHLNLPSSGRSSFERFFLTDQPIVVQITFTVIHLTGRSLSRHSIKFKEGWETQRSGVSGRREGRFPRTANSLCHSPCGAFVFDTAVMFLRKHPQVHLLVSAIPLVLIFSIFSSWSYTSTGTLFLHLCIDAMLSLQTQYVPK